MSEKEIPEYILNRLKKLLIFKEGVEKIDSKSEIENVSIRINELLLKYNLSIEDINISEKKEGLEKEELKYSVSTCDNKWHDCLLNIISRYNLCKFIIVNRTRTQHKGYIIGKKLNRQIIKYTVDHLVIKIINMAKFSFKEYLGNEKRNTYIRGYKLGCVDGIDLKLNGHKKDMQKNIKMNSLMLRNEIEISEFINNNLGGLKKSKISKTSLLSGYFNGYIDGKNIELNKGIENNSVKSRMLE